MTMNSRLSTMLGALVGLALAAVLLVPAADSRVLAAQGVRNLLGEQLPGDTSPEGLAGWMAATESAPYYYVRRKNGAVLLAPAR